MDPAARALTARIGQRLRAERKRHRLTLADLSARAGLSRSCLGGYERGARRPSIETATALAAALESVTPAWLLCLDEAPPPLTDDELTLIHRFRTADPDRQRMIVNVTRTIALCDSNRRKREARTPDPPDAP